MPRIIAVLGIILIALASCAVPAALVRADEARIVVADMVGAERAAFIKLWKADVIATNAEANPSDWIFEDTGENFDGGPVMKVTIPGLKYCIVALVPGDPKVYRMIGCAELDGTEKSKRGT